MNNYQIRKNKHYAEGFNFGFLFRPKRIKKTVIFSENCLYHFDDLDNYDINKLFGMSFGYHHNSSIRIGWNCQNNLGNISVFSYVYEKGKRREVRLASLRPGHRYDMDISFDYDNNLFFIRILDERNKIVASHRDNFDYPLIKAGYKLFPYFGGDKPAPHDMNILFWE